MLAKMPPLRKELLRIAEMVPASARVLDVGCGSGELIEYLARTQNVDARGIELSQHGVNACVAKGLSVIQGDADTDLSEYPPSGFDFVILSQTIQATRQPKAVLEQLLRIGKRVIVSFPNFGFWKVRLKLALTGRMPRTGTLSHAWHETPNIHLCTIADFVALTREIDAKIERSLAVEEGGEIRELSEPGYWDNLTAEGAIFLLMRPHAAPGPT
ncbi:MAG: methionine biosynthesis protein MetW [Alphaproteobacteria bacterium]|nr:methionine biosynthesis protein MetW [Alphaproteobacteria bacterium]